MKSVESSLISLRSVGGKVTGLMDTAAEALTALSEVDVEKSQALSKLAEKFAADLAEVRRIVHAHIQSLGADFRTEDPSRDSFIRADLSLQKLTYVNDILQRTIEDVAAARQATSRQDPPTSMHIE